MFPKTTKNNGQISDKAMIIQSLVDINIVICKISMQIQKHVSGRRLAQQAPCLYVSSGTL